MKTACLTVCVVTTVAGTCLTAAVPRDRGAAEDPGATVISLAPVTLAAMVMMLAHEEAARGLLPVVVVMVMV